MNAKTADPTGQSITPPAEVLVGRKLRALRSRARLSLRALAERSGLNVNTLSLVENGKSSPSVSTLQQLARALDVPIAAFFEFGAGREKGRLHACRAATAGSLWQHPHAEPGAGSGRQRRPAVCRQHGTRHRQR